jgi:hypothetical protein
MLDCLSNGVTMHLLSRELAADMVFQMQSLLRSKKSQQSIDTYSLEDCVSLTLHKLEKLTLQHWQHVLQWQHVLSVQDIAGCLSPAWQALPLRGTSQLATHK